MTAPHTDTQLLTIARRVLNHYGFRVEERHLEDLERAGWLLAENEYFLLGVAAGETFDDLAFLEGYVARELGDLIGQTDLGAKRWDSYVVLLASSGGDQRGRPDVVRLEYNTRSLRRIVALGTPAHEESVASALATFLPLPELLDEGLPSPFDQLVDHLVVNGVPVEEAQSAVTTYRADEASHGD